MYLLTTLAYPAVLLLLCAGAGLLVDRCSGGWLPAALLPITGAAALIAISQLCTYAYPLARATPYVMLAAGLGGLVVGAPRLRSLAHGGRALAWPVLAPALVYALALAPVLLAGRATFSSYMALADSAVHMLGADYLIHHGQHYAHLDLRNSYGRFLDAYYNSSYPSGSDTLFGGSALLLGLSLAWAFQPFNAFMLACAAGPAWVLARRIGLRGGWATAAAVSVTVPALVYGYALVGSVKEITALGMILALGALTATHARWLAGPARGAIPFALLAAAGVSALGVGFAVWPLVATAVLLVVMLAGLRAGRGTPGGYAALAGSGAVVLFVAALPTWLDLSGSLHLAQAISSTSNPGNLPRPLRASQVVGVWIRGSYKQSPTGAALGATRVLIALALASCAAGAVYLLRRRRLALAGWLALMLAAWLAVGSASTTWVTAKGEMLTSCAVVLLAWSGIAALLDSSRPALRRAAAPLVAVALAGGVLASDFAQYHSSNLAPTARLDELASLNSRFAGQGPALLTDFDEYALYELRGLDVGGPDFAYPPPQLAALAGGYGRPVQLDRATPASLRGYPLIITRRDPSAPAPPAAYSLRWQGRYYDVWGRTASAPASVHVALSGAPAARCSQVARVAGLASRDGRAPVLIASSEPVLVRVSLAAATHPPGWGHQRSGLVMSRPGSLQAAFSVPRAGVWQLWLQGQLMPPVALSIDGRRVGSVSGQLDGNSLVPDTVHALSLTLAAGRHRIALSRGGFTLAPGNGGSAVLDAIFLTPGGEPARTLREVPAASWRALCDGEYAWVEALSAA